MFRRVGRVSSVAVSFVVYYIYVDLTIRPASIRAVGLGVARLRIQSEHSPPWGDNDCPFNDALHHELIWNALELMA